MSEAFFTVGHSNHTLTEFIRVLREAKIDRVVDVRRLRGSSKYPWFDADVLDTSLGEAGIAFDAAPGLAGRRAKSKVVPFEVNAWWENQSFHNYADHALGSEFQDALAELRELGALERIAVMCAEAVWWRCHRRIIADHLLAAGERVTHLMGSGRESVAELSAGCIIDPEGRVTYPAGDS